jgi:hypothetical protein
MRTNMQPGHGPGMSGLMGGTGTTGMDHHHHTAGMGAAGMGAAGMGTMGTHDSHTTGTGTGESMTHKIKKMIPGEDSCHVMQGSRVYLAACAAHSSVLSGQ